MLEEDIRRRLQHQRCPLLLLVGGRGSTGEPSRNWESIPKTRRRRDRGCTRLHKEALPGDYNNNWRIFKNPGQIATAICIYLDEHLGRKAATRLKYMAAPGINVRVGRRRKRLDISLGGDRWSRLVWNYHILALVHPTRKVEMSALDCKCRLIYHMVFNANLFEAVCNVTGKESLNFCVKCEYPPQIEQK